MMVPEDYKKYQSMALRQTKEDLDKTFQKAEDMGANISYEYVKDGNFAINFQGEIHEFSDTKIGYENARFWIEDQMKEFNIVLD